MDPIIEFLNSHASVRKFTGQPITEEQERTIVATAQRSPTSSNLQAYSIISVRDDDKKSKLADLCGGQEHVAASALFLVFCADLYRLGRLTEQRGYPFHGDHTEMFIVATVDAALAGARALMAAQALGFGGVMVGGIRNHPREVAQLIGLPRLTYAVMGMSLGQPVSPPKIKPRLPLSGLCFNERYQEEQCDPSVAEYDRTIDELGYLRGREVTPEQYPQFEGPYSWSEHSARRTADDRPGVLRPHMREYLQGCGFLLK
jgi:nitroreductase